MRFVGFIGPSYTAQSVNVDAQRCVNLYPELDDLGTGKEREVASLVSTPGLTLLLTLPTSPIRGVYQASTGTVYAVAGSVLYSISSVWAYTVLGSLNTSTGNVNMVDNGFQVIVVDGTYGYSFQISGSSFGQITDPNFLGSTHVTFQDGYFIFNKPNSQVVYVSPLNAITPFNSLAFSTINGAPDNMVGLISAQQSLYLFGSQHTEVYYDSGDTPMPFTRIQGAMVGVGCIAPYSIIQLQGQVYWVGCDANGQGIVYRMEGYQPQRVSTPAIERIIRSIGTTNAAGIRAWSYQQGGHLFYCLNLPTTGSTWVFDAQSNLWHERTYLGSFGFERHRIDCACVGYGQNIGGDYANGNIYMLDQNGFTDNGVSIVRLRSSPHITDGLVRLAHYKFQLDMETGVGLATGQGADPQAMLEWSDDGGHTWSNQYWRSAGPAGNTKKRVIWRRLGVSRDRIYRVSISDPVKVTLIGADIDYQEGIS